MREKLPVFLLMTGLYKNVDGLRNAEGMTFLERAPRTVLGPLPESRIAEKYETVLEIRPDRAARLARKTCGYSFAFQTIGYFCFEYREDEERALQEAKDYLYEFAYRKIWSELSGKDREVLSAAAGVLSGCVCDIREKLGMTSNQFNPYRDRLIKAGILLGKEKGRLEWALPFFGEFSREMSS